MGSFLLHSFISVRKLHSYLFPVIPHSPPSFLYSSLSIITMVFCGFELVLEPGRMDIAAAAVQAFIGAVAIQFLLS
ncbi:hypothetical protein ES332_D06G184500v1 [Gossypium tomentosum]|nr:hypothetical protein ES332_D06G184500v1 [Gossypium tomentosum]